MTEKNTKEEVDSKYKEKSGGEESVLGGATRQEWWRDRRRWRGLVNIQTRSDAGPEEGIYTIVYDCNQTKTFTYILQI